MLLAATTGVHGPACSSVRDQHEPAFMRPDVPARPDGGAVGGGPAASPGRLCASGGITGREMSASVFRRRCIDLARHIALVRHRLSIKHDVISTHYVTTTMHANVWLDVFRSQHAKSLDPLLQGGRRRLLPFRGKMAKPYVPGIPTRLHSSKTAWTGSVRR